MGSCGTERMLFSLDQSGHLFVKSVEKMSFNDSVVFCSSLGGELPMAKTRRDSKFLMKSSQPLSKSLTCFGPWLSRNQSLHSQSSSETCKTTCCAYQLCNKNKFMSVDCDLKRTAICNLTLEASAVLMTNRVNAAIHDIEVSASDNDRLESMAQALRQEEEEDEGDNTYTTTNYSFLSNNKILGATIGVLTVCVLILGIILGIMSLTQTRKHHRHSSRRTVSGTAVPFDFSESLILDRL